MKMENLNPKRSKKAILFVQHYRPGYEGVSNEIEQLVNYLEKKDWKVKIHDLHFQNPFRFKLNGKIISYHFAFYPFTFIGVYVYSLFFDIRHIFTSLCDTPYLPIIRKKPLLLTAAAPYNKEKLKKRVDNLKKTSLIILENEIQKEQLKEIGFEKTTKIIYPGVDLVKFNHQTPKDGPFTILFASSPKDPEMFIKRGVNLMLDVAKEIKKEALFDFSWAAEGPYLDSYLKVKNLIVKKGLTNIKLTNNIEHNMNERFAKAHCTIIPYTELGDFVKLTPNSALESLAAGKPVLCSSKSGAAKMVKDNEVGIVFEPDKDSLIDAIKRLKKNYDHYQQNCRKVAENKFSKKMFEEEYGQVYNDMMVKNNGY